MNYFIEVKKICDLNIEDNLLISIVFEMNRFYDSQFTDMLKQLKLENNIIFDSPTRKSLRKKYYYGDYYKDDNLCKIKSCEYKKEDIEIVFKDCFDRLNKYDQNKIISSMRQRVDDISNNTGVNTHSSEWINYYKRKTKSYLYSFLAIRINQELYDQINGLNGIYDFITRTYDSLENYRHLAVVIDREIFNDKKECITWNVMYKLGIFVENFIGFKEDYHPFHKEKQINNLTAFLNERNIKDSNRITSDFYKHISTGYRFEDCYISDNQSTKIMIYKKIKLDNSNVPCPSCNSIIQRGNSYPEVFLRSWECTNPSCPDRSKSGRGKRFDEYGTYRYFKLVENDPLNRIDEELYQNWRRDVFDNGLDWTSFIIKEYTYSKEKIFLFNIDIDNAFNRKTINIDYLKLNIAENSTKCFDKLPIVSLFKKICSNCAFNNKGTTVLKDVIEIFNDNSTLGLQKLKPGQIGTAITSPPYYNAREYSQWGTLIMYYVDMLLNCKAVYNAMKKGGYYLYNIGDIVSEDNVYVVSNMSKHRVQLGFLSCMIFEIAGYNLTGNLIWDKGEVQSKRSSTTNLFSGYVKCINCYEHIFVFRKGKYEKLSNTVERFNPVIKINSKGENLYKHTAPYPLDLVELLKPYVNKKLYVLDPFLGSGTTLKWCKLNSFKGVGYELNKDYYELCKDNVFSTYVITSKLF